MDKSILKEVAASGSIGAASIAVNPTPIGSSNRTKTDIPSNDEKDTYVPNGKLKKVKKTLKNKNNKKSFVSFIKRKFELNEELDFDSILSQLKGIENTQNKSSDGVVAYGIEDDKGNFMRVTVRSDQAKDFEMTMARKLADNEDDIAIGNMSSRKSLAEILYDLQSDFDIIDVEFPVIPKDAVYNVNDAVNGDNVSTPDDMAVQSDQDNSDLDSTLSDNDLDGEFSMDNAPEENPDNQLDQGETNPELGDENVEDFGEEEPESSTELLKSLVDMLKKQAEAETAKAQASAEEARATQAEWSAIAADKEVRRAEDLARVQADLEEKKKKEKMAKQYAQVAKYNAEQGNSALSDVGESLIVSLLTKNIIQLSEDDGDTMDSLQKLRLAMTEKYRILPDDDQNTRQYKSNALRLSLEEINARANLVKLNTQYNNQKNQQQQQQQNQQTNTQPNNQQTQQTQQQPNNGQQQ